MPRLRALPFTFWLTCWTVLLYLHRCRVSLEIRCVIVCWVPMGVGYRRDRAPLRLPCAFRCHCPEIDQLRIRSQVLPSTFEEPPGPTSPFQPGCGFDHPRRLHAYRWRLGVSRRRLQAH
jgi:hypothetical protein